MTATYRIEGMSCSHCAASVQKALQDKGFAAKVTVDPPQVRIDGAALPPRDVIAATVASAGDYTLGAEVAATEAKGGLFAKFKQALKGA